MRQFSDRQIGCPANTGKSAADREGYPTIRKARRESNSASHNIDRLNIVLHFVGLWFAVRDHSFSACGGKQIAAGEKFPKKPPCCNFDGAFHKLWLH